MGFPVCQTCFEVELCCLYVRCLYIDLIHMLDKIQELETQKCIQKSTKSIIWKPSWKNDSFWTFATHYHPCLHISDRYWVIRNFTHVISVWHFSYCFVNLSQREYRVCIDVVVWKLTDLLNHLWRLLLKETSSSPLIFLQPSQYEWVVAVPVSQRELLNIERAQGESECLQQCKQYESVINK